MTDYVKRFLNMVVVSFLAHANRLARLVAVRHLVEAYTEAFEEAAQLEAKGHGRVRPRNYVNSDGPLG